MAKTLTERPLTTDDAAGVAAVHAAMEAAEPVDEMYTETDVLEKLVAPSVDLENSSIGVFDDAALVAFGVLAVSLPAATWKAELLGGVLPDYTGRGIGRRIVVGLEGFARRDRDRDAPGHPGERKAWVDENRCSTMDLLSAAGYETWRYFFRMHLELSSPRQPVAAPDDVEIRPYRGVRRRATA